MTYLAAVNKVDPFIFARKNTDRDRNGRVDQHHVVLCQVHLLGIHFVGDDGRHLHALTVQHGFSVEHERDQDRHRQIFRRQSGCLFSVIFSSSVLYFLVDHPPIIVSPSPCCRVTSMVSFLMLVLGVPLCFIAWTLMLIERVMSARFLFRITSFSFTSFPFSGMSS